MKGYLVISIGDDGRIVAAGIFSEPAPTNMRGTAVLATCDSGSFGLNVEWLEKVARARWPYVSKLLAERLGGSR